MVVRERKDVVLRCNVVQFAWLGECVRVDVVLTFSGVHVMVEYFAVVCISNN